MQQRYDLAFTLYPYARSPDQDRTAHHPVVIVGGGPVGLATALDLGLQGVPVLLLDDHEGVGAGSRAICFAKRTLEICDRLGAAGPMLDKGVVWNKGKVFRDDRLLYEFNLAPEDGHAFPAFINLPQPYFEKFLHDRIVQAQAAGAPITLRGRNRVDGVTATDTGVTLQINTPDGPYALTADWVVACDGARSPLRGMLGFWFEPHFKSGAPALLHKQPDDIWRIDFQLGWDTDRAKELEPANIRARVSAMLGPGVDYDLAWTSIYTFQCRRMDKFRHRRVLFAGDAAHQVSPFGARGANSGIQDVDNLCWKLKLVLDGVAPDRLLDSYSDERVYGADENILNSTRATDFITPKSAMSKTFRIAVLDPAEHVPFARTLVNSGRLSVPCIYDGLSLNGPDHPDLPARARPGSPLPDAPVPQGWLLAQLPKGFSLISIDADMPDGFIDQGLTLTVLKLTATDNPALEARYLGHATSAVYLIRPDQHVAARWTQFDATAVSAALSRALGKEP